MHLRHLRISSKNSAKIIQPISQWVLIESIFWLNEILAMHLIRKRVEINGKHAFNPTAKSTWTHAHAGA